MNSEPLLEIVGLRAAYGVQEVLRGIDLRLDAGSFTVVLGSNGAGKTTLLRSVMGLVPRVSGERRFEGRGIGGLRPAKIVRGGIAMAPEGRQVFPSLTVIENLLAGRLAGGAAGRGRRSLADSLDEAFSYFPRLAERRHQAAGTLSGGEQQMVAIARALMSQPKLLLVDEASLGLAPIMVETLFELVTAINRDGIAVLAVEQNVALVDDAHAVVVLEHGQIVFSGPVTRGDEALRHHVVAAYMGLDNA